MAILKLFHVLFVFVWIGTLLVVTRMLAYQAKEEPSVQARFCRLFKRLYMTVELPSMLIAVALGLILLFVNGVNWKAPWLHMKLTFAFFLILCDLMNGRFVWKYSRQPIVGNGWQFKVLHGIAGLFFIGVLIAIYILKAKVH